MEERDVLAALVAMTVVDGETSSQFASTSITSIMGKRHLDWCVEIEDALRYLRDRGLVKEHESVTFMGDSQVVWSATIEGVYETLRR